MQCHWITTCLCVSMCSICALWCSVCLVVVMVWQMFSQVLLCVFLVWYSVLSASQLPNTCFTHSWRSSFEITQCLIYTTDFLSHIQCLIYTTDFLSHIQCLIYTTDFLSHIQCLIYTADFVFDFVFSCQTLFVVILIINDFAWPSGNWFDYIVK